MVVCAWRRFILVTLLHYVLSVGTSLWNPSACITNHRNAPYKIFKKTSPMVLSGLFDMVLLAVQDCIFQGWGSLVQDWVINCFVM